jgi:hypothetical protein
MCKATDLDLKTHLQHQPTTDIFAADALLAISTTAVMLEKNQFLGGL